MSRYREWAIDQPMLLPPSVTEFVKLGHVALDGTKVRAEWSLLCTAHNLLKLAAARA